MGQNNIKIERISRGQRRWLNPNVMEKQQPTAEKDQGPWTAKRAGKSFFSSLTTARPKTSSPCRLRGHVTAARELGWVAVNKAGRGPG